jgi:hypothetical protein
MTDTNIRYPDDFDGDDNLYHAVDALRLTLLDDYNPGDTSIILTGELSQLAYWPSTGLITLTEQCSEIDFRAISFSYDSVDADTGVISGLLIRPGFSDVVKPKRITHVTCNVMAEHHNSVKDALKAIQGFVGVKDTIDTQPFGTTLEGRINFLRNVVLQPKAWFDVDKTIGNIPFEVEFADKSFRLGTDGTSGPVTIEWDFGDQTTSTVSTISVVSATSIAPNDPNAYVIDLDGGKIKKTYYQAGLYDVRMRVTNDFGSDEVVFKELINARIPAPQEAVVKYAINSGQNVTDGIPSDGPYTVVPKIRSPINTLITLDVQEGENASTPGYSYAGELLNSYGNPLDPVVSYTWALGDDLNHPNSPNTKAAYSIGGIYDMKLRVDTEFGAYRITTYKNSIDIVENLNLWTWVFTDLSETQARPYEYGLLSETFKLNSNQTLSVTRDASFLDSVPDSARQKREFRRNTGFAPRGTTPSGSRGWTMLYWASGRNALQPKSAENIYFTEYNGFDDTYLARDPVARPWNWASFASTSAAYFCFGSTLDSSSPNSSPTNPERLRYDLTSFATTSTTMTSSDFENGAQELLQNPATFDGSGDSIYGDYSVTRTSWKDNTGYIARNDGVGDYFRIKSFYRTEGTLGNPVKTIRKLIDVQGTTKLEGQLGDLSLGIYMFNNSGSISAYGISSSTWSTGGPGINSAAYRTLQDSTAQDYDNPSNTLLVSTDKDRRAYLAFDYSNRVFLKFNEIDLTFSTLGARPNGGLWIMGIY